MSDSFARLSLAELAQPIGFRADARFGECLDHEEGPASVEELAPQDDAADPVTQAFADGYMQGFEQARDEARAQAATDAAAGTKLALSFARLDAALEEELRLRLRDTVAALCEAAIAPLALDPDMLARRVATAASMLARADDARMIRLNPRDMDLLAPRFRAEWEVQPDASLERGTVRVESVTGGVEDGPATWRRAIAEALHQC